MKKLFLVGIALLMVFSLALAACGKGDTAAGDDKANQGNQDVADNQGEADNQDEADDQGEVDTSDLYITKGDPDLKADLTIWAITPTHYDKYVPLFNKHYPNVKINFVNMGFEVQEKTLTAIAAGSGGPDIVQWHTNWLSDMTSLPAGLENLLDPPYNAGRYEDDFTEGNWRRYMSIDGKRLIALPGEYVPDMTIYRQDIMEDYGYPSDPNEFGDYIQDEENFINMASTFKKDKKWIFPLKGDALLRDGFFDENLNYTRNNAEFARLFNITKRLSQLSLIANLMVPFDAKANQALGANELILVPTTWLTVGHIVRQAPDTMGKWRITRLPFGNNRAGQGVSMSILSQSKQKEAAWAFLQFCDASIEGQSLVIENSGMVPFKPVAKDPAYLNQTREELGDQKPYQVATEVLETTPVYVATPLDKVARTIWDEGLVEMLEKNMDPLAALQQIEEDTMAAVKVDRDELLQSMGK